jgi:hypothetical protein
VNRDRAVRIAAYVLLVAMVLAIVLGAVGAATAAPADPPPALPGTTTTAAQELPDRCEGSALPQLGCGEDPEEAGDRGGALQWLTFGIVVAGLLTIGTVIVRSTARRDREKAASISR